MRRPSTLTAVAVIFAAGIAVGLIIAQSGSGSEGIAAAAMQDSPTTVAKISPVRARPRDFYAPNSEDLAPDEMRVIACGTGMPTARPSQAAACFLVELGNGDKFLFDIGTGSAERVAALQIPYNFLDKVFLGHLHTDHFGDIDALFVGGALCGRQKPLQVYGPSGAKPEYGTAYAMDHLRKYVNWDLAGRQGLVDERGYHLETHEFDYRKANQIVYQENGVTIRSWPAIHSLDGPVSFALEWNGLKFVFGSDTYPNKWFVKHATNADLVIHECFVSVPSLIEKFKFIPQTALAVGTQIHTAPEAFGKVMSLVRPRMAVAYHFFKDYDTTASINDRIRTTYDGPLSLAEDFMVWNVTKDDIRVRMAVVNEEVWPPPATKTPLPPDPSRRIAYSDLIAGGKLDVDDVLQPIYDEINKQYGLNEQPD
ncbi:MAG: guanitoxin biosynthesis MBL fold metallo-hydrolase GntH [Planctomycetota bacterium]